MQVNYLNDISFKEKAGAAKRKIIFQPASGFQKQKACIIDKEG